MRKSWVTLALAVTMGIVALGTAPSAVAQQTSTDVRIDVNLKDADMVAATQAITRRTGLQFVIEPSVEPFNRITLKLDGVTAEDAIAYIAQAAGAFVRRDVNGVYIISRTKPVEAAPTTNATTVEPKRVLQTKKLRLVRSDPRVVLSQLIGRAVTDGDLNFEVLRKFRREDVQNALGGVWGSAADMNVLPSAQPVATRNFGSPATGMETGNDVALPGEGANQFGGGQLGGGGGIGGGGGQPGGAGGIGGGGQPGGAGGAGNAQLRGGEGLVPQSIDFISYDPTDNSLIVRGTSEEDIAELQRTISLFDVAPRQVQIRVEFITTTENITRSLGYDFLFQRGSVFAGNRPGSFARTGDPVFINYATGNITTRLRAELTEGRGKVVQAPILRTLNNQPALLQSAIQTTVFINQTTVSNGTVITTANPQSLVASTELAIAPRINDDGTITVFLTPQIQSFVGTSRGPNGEEIPNVVSQLIRVVARVRNGETIVLGGLTSKNDDNSVSRIPVLSDLPIIGQFFRGTRRQRVNSDLLIFVTPTVLEDDETSGG